MTQPEKPVPVEEKRVPKEAAVTKVVEKKKTVEEKTKPAAEEPLKDDKVKSAIDIHIVGKIDLETVSRETRAPKKEEKEIPEVKQEDNKDSLRENNQEPVEQEQIPAADTVSEVKALEVKADENIPGEITSEREESEVISIFKPPVKKLSGLTVVGKINLPVEEKKKPAYQQVNIDGESDFRRKREERELQRKRIRLLLLSRSLQIKRIGPLKK